MAEKRSATSPVEAIVPVVVVVDDDPTLRRALCRALIAGGCEVLEAPNGNSAVRLVARRRIDVVVSDVRMPDMNGIELLGEVSSLDEATSVVLISGAPDLETALKAVQLGASEYLTKPIEHERLIESVRRGARKSRRRREEGAALDSLRSGTRYRHSSVPSSGSWTGSVLGGRYRIGEEIGSGGMGTVYEAKRSDLADMSVAVKIVHSRHRFNHDVSARFLREAETLARLSHQNIVRILDYEVSEEGPAYIVMELLQGISFADVIVQEGSLAVGRTVFIAIQTLFALESAHEHGIVHRDLKPENLFLMSVSGVKDIVRVLDFGVAKLIEGDSETRLTRTGAVMGTPLYLAPEQARGSAVDARSDLYSVGTIMYEALTGKPPFEAENYNALLVRIQEDDAEDLRTLRSEVDPALAAVVARSMAKNPKDRYQSAREMIEALEPWIPTIEPRARVTHRPPARSKESELAHRLKTTRREDGSS